MQKVKITKCSPDPLLSYENRKDKGLIWARSSYNLTKPYPSDFADIHEMDIKSNFPAQYEQLEVNAYMKQFALYNHGIRPYLVVS